MNPGKLDTKVSIQEPDTPVNPLGDRTETTTYTELTKRSAEVKHLRGSELDRAKALDAQIQSKITVRYDSKTSLIKKDWRVVHGLDVYHILYPLPVPGGSRSNRIELYCRSNV